MYCQTTTSVSVHLKKRLKTNRLQTARATACDVKNTGMKLTTLTRPISTVLLLPQEYTNTDFGLYPRLLFCLRAFLAGRAGKIKAKPTSINHTAKTD